MKILKLNLITEIMKNKIAFAMIMGVVTTGIISFTLISINIGFIDRFLGIWLKSWGMAYLVVIPAILIIAPIIQDVVDRFFPVKSKDR
jgi:hypothetical protein